MDRYLENIRVLVVDDQGFIRRIVCQMLDVIGAKDVSEAIDGSDAWEKFEECEPDLIIADWEMRPTSGLEFVKRIRNDDESPNPYVPIIMLTGHSEIERVEEARDSGINEFVAKPISAKALYDKIISVIENPRQFIRTKMYFGPSRRRQNIAVENERRDTG